MKNPIHIPEMHSFATAIVVLYASTSSSFAGYLCARWLQTASFLVVYTVVMVLVLGGALWGLGLGLRSVTEHSMSASILGAPTGLAAGAAAVWGDRKVKRYAWRQHPGRRRVRRSGEPRTGPGPGSLPPLSTRQLSVLVLPTGRAPTASPTERPPALTEPVRSLALLMLVAVLEEALFRGVLVELALSVHARPVAVISVAATAVLFALVHIPFGLVEVFSKLPLSILALATVLMLGTVVPAMLAHVLFNVWMWRALVVPLRHHSWA